MTLPNPAYTIETLMAKPDAVDMVDKLLARNVELEEIYQQLQPLLYALSVKLYADDDETITLEKLIEDSIAFINPEGENLQ